MRAPDDTAVPAPTVLGLHSIALFVPDLDRSVSFYRALLGVAPAERRDRIALFRVGDAKLLLHGDTEHRRIPPGTPRGAGLALHFEVGDIHAFREGLRRAGIAVTEEPELQPYGVWELALRDPDGYEVEFVQPVVRERGEQREQKDG